MIKNKVMKFSYLLILLLSIVSFLSCDEDNLDSDGCEENKICTEEFRTISLEITNQDGDAVVLDDFYTFLDSRKSLSTL